MRKSFLLLLFLISSICGFATNEIIESQSLPIERATTYVQTTAMLREGLIDINAFDSYDYLQDSDGILYAANASESLEAVCLGLIEAPNEYANITIKEEIIFNGKSYNVVEIANSAFFDCTFLQNITLPATIKKIGFRAFAGCTNLESVYYNGTISDWATISSYSYSTNGTIYAYTLDLSANPLMYASKLYLLQAPNIYTEVPSNIEIKDNYNSSSYVYTNITSACAYLPVTHISIAGKLLSGDVAMFSNCPNLLEITFNLLATSSIRLADFVFSSNPKLEKVNFGVDSIRYFTNDYYFTGCPNLKLLDFSQYTFIPDLGSRALYQLPSDCIIKVPDSLYETWKETSGWITYESQIKPKSEVSE